MGNAALLQQQNEGKLIAAAPVREADARKWYGRHDQYNPRNNDYEPDFDGIYEQNNLFAFPRPIPKVSTRNPLLQRKHKSPAEETEIRNDEKDREGRLLRYESSIAESSQYFASDVDDKSQSSYERMLDAFVGRAPAYRCYIPREENTESKSNGNLQPQPRPASVQIAPRTQDAKSVLSVSTVSTLRRSRSAPALSTIPNIQFGALSHTGKPIPLMRNADTEAIDRLEKQRKLEEQQREETSRQEIAKVMSGDVDDMDLVAINRALQNEKAREAVSLPSNANANAKVRTKLSSRLTKGKYKGALSSVWYYVKCVASLGIFSVDDNRYEPDSNDLPVVNARKAINELLNPNKQHAQLVGSEVSAAPAVTPQVDQSQAPHQQTQEAGNQNMGAAAVPATLISSNAAPRSVSPNLSESPSLAESVSAPSSPVPSPSPSQHSAAHILTQLQQEQANTVYVVYVDGSAVPVVLPNVLSPSPQPHSEQPATENEGYVTAAAPAAQALSRSQVVAAFAEYSILCQHQDLSAMPTNTPDKLALPACEAKENAAANHI